MDFRFGFNSENTSGNEGTKKPTPYSNKYCGFTGYLTGISSELEGTKVVDRFTIEVDTVAFLGNVIAAWLKATPTQQLKGNGNGGGSGGGDSGSHRRWSYAAKDSGNGGGKRKRSDEDAPTSSPSPRVNT
ncbi:hypothetical protein B0H14DRAFT_2572646 [Mycena olivaceomarginata]|nr:hypothetical protein B0H14DRAFT_2572646 [Mycena olivaceomarginata]